mgnify:CR=1 FL=1
MNNSAHNHQFEMDSSKNERLSKYVVLITLITMFVEIITGYVSGSMALLADGWHMGTHAFAIAIGLGAYYLSRKYAKSTKFSFGTGKICILASYSSAILLAVAAIIMIFESIGRIIKPINISFNEAIFIAAIGLLVNVICAMLLHRGNGHGHSHQHEHAPHTLHDHGHKDHNLKAVYIHVIADALTSVTAIIALIFAKYTGWNFMDPIMGIVGGVLICVWAWSLLKDTGMLLLDYNKSDAYRERITNILVPENPENLLDYHVWNIGSNTLSGSFYITGRSLEDLPALKENLSNEIRELKHITIEVIHLYPNLELMQIITVYIIRSTTILVDFDRVLYK